MRNATIRLDKIQQYSIVREEHPALLFGGRKSCAGGLFDIRPNIPEQCGSPLIVPPLVDFGKSVASIGVLLLVLAAGSCPSALYETVAKVLECEFFGCVAGYIYMLVEMLFLGWV